MLRSDLRPRWRLAAASVVLGAGLLTASPALAATNSLTPRLQPAAVAATHGSATFVVGNTSAVDGMNPFVGQTGTDFEVYGLIYDDLTDYGQLDYSAQPRLATSWSVSPNQLVWTYHIRHGVKWSDGVPLTAADVAYTFQRDIVPNSLEYSDNSAYVQNITSVRQTGPYTHRLQDPYRALERVRRADRGGAGVRD